MSIVEFKEPRKLKKEGASRYDYVGGQADILPAANPNVQQGYLEKSNVNPSEEMIKMIEAYRNFESVQRRMIFFILIMDRCPTSLINPTQLETFSQKG